MGLRHGFVVIVWCLALSACASNDIIVKKQVEMEARLEQLIQGNNAATTQLTMLSAEVKELQAQVRSHSADIEGLKAAGKQAAPVRETALPPKPQASAPKIEFVNNETTPFDKEENVQDAYMKAFGLYSANNYSGAITAFEAFITAYPDSEYAGNAQYWIGECFYTQHDYPRALEAFRKVGASYPQGQKVPDSLLKIGLTYISMNEGDKANAAFQELLEKYPRSQAAAKARQRLERH